MKLTKKKAKKICIEIGEYLINHPSISSKFDMPIEILQKIRGMAHTCPLCELFWLGSNKNELVCPGCPLSVCQRKSKYGDYGRWRWADTDKKRIKYMSKMLEKVKAWEV